MDRIIAPFTVTLPNADVAPTTGVPGLATDGNPATATPATIWPAYGWNMVSEEIRNLIIRAGLTPNGADWTQLTQAVQAFVNSINIAMVSYETPGTLTFTVPPNVFLLRVEVAGGGGGGSQCITAGGSGGGQSGAGGGAGGYASGVFAVTPGEVISITVGAGGATQAAGGTSSCGTFCSATGGQGASFAGGTTGSAGAAGGTGVGGFFNAVGGYGGDGQSAGLIFAGNGAPGPWGGGGRAGAGGGLAGTAPGAGGGGAYDPANTGTRYNGGAGAPGAVRIEYLEPTL